MVFEGTDAGSALAMYLFEDEGGEGFSHFFLPCGVRVDLCGDLSRAEIGISAGNVGTGVERKLCVPGEHVADFVQDDVVAVEPGNGGAIDDVVVDAVVVPQSER